MLIFLPYLLEQQMSKVLYERIFTLEKWDTLVTFTQKVPLLDYNKRKKEKSGTLWDHGLYFLVLPLPSIYSPFNYPFNSPFISQNERIRLSVYTCRQQQFTIDRREPYIDNAGALNRIAAQKHWQKLCVVQIENFIILIGTHDLSSRSR